MRRRSYQQGFTILEIMLALFLGLLVTGGVIQIYLSSKVTYRVQEGLARVQENGRMAVDRLGRDLRSAGYIGCLSALGSTDLTNTLNSSGALELSFGVPMRGFEDDTSAWLPSLPTSLSNLNPKLGTDIITVRSATGDLPVTQHNTPSADIKSSDEAGDFLDQFDIVIVHDCQQGAVFQITNLNDNGNGAGFNLVHNTGAISQCANGNGVCPGNATTDLGQSYFPDGRISRALTVAYYIDQDNILHRFDMLRGADRRLIEGVEDMQILYGVNADTNDGADVFTTADTVESSYNWNAVVSARICLVVRSENNLTPAGEAQVYRNCAGTAITPSANDRRLRRVFTASISLRNRLP